MKNDPTPQLEQRAAEYRGAISVEKNRKTKIRLLEILREINAEIRARKVQKGTL